MKAWLLNILIWLDCGINTIIFAGSPYETISSRVGKQRQKGARWACVLCKFLDLLDDRHCDTTQVSDNGRTLPNWWK